MKIGCQLTEISAKNMRSWLITFNVTLGILYFITVYRRDVTRTGYAQVMRVAELKLVGKRENKLQIIYL